MVELHNYIRIDHFVMDDWVFSAISMLIIEYVCIFRYE